MTDLEALRIALHSAVVADMGASRPKNLVRAMEYQAEDMAREAVSLAREDDFRQALLVASPGDRLVGMWRKLLTQWDIAEQPMWSTSLSRTDERRADIYRLLGVDGATHKLLEASVPRANVAPPVVISTKFVPWYTPQSQQGRPWYWPSYEGVLRRKGWSEEAIAGLDLATDRVVERLADPTRFEAYQSKGLVVGYVQSGKTANFTGVIAKAIDAGYRLVIVLGGTLNLLRGQTQRRLDMELVGRENILRGANEFESDYADDPAWIKRRFVEFGGLPSSLGAFDIVRMTTRNDDYKSLLQGIVALEFEKQEPALPLYDTRNLHRSSARLMVVKKNKSVLAKLVKDLNKIKTPLTEIPVLIIDDESDEASVNTSRPKPDADRTAINQKVSDLLTMLPRAQYVGYTATPYANVFIDPSDTADIFPKDFIVSLPRPDGYMGASDFHDLDSEIAEAERTVSNSNEMAHVRDVVIESDDDTACLQQAIDMFVLTAAMKLYREDRGGLGDRYFVHHTMLIHESSWIDVHRELLGRVTKLWWNAGYLGSAGHERLRTLFDDDVAPVSAARSEGLAVPDTYDELMPYVGPAAVRIGGDDKPIIVVNGDKDIETGEADFDKRSIWKILIGGQKLSRGFTVEGLTISYFRRRASNVSSLMQMGRWFGFRAGYQDLVRLYIGREELGVKDKAIDLYRAFEAVCLDEESFRSELNQYAVLVDGEPQVTPGQVPPLVAQHLPWLKPASPNKMYNSKLVEIHSAGQWEELTAYPTAESELRYNTHLWLPVFESLSTETVGLSYNFAETGKKHTFPALTGKMGATELLDLVGALKWSAPSQFAPHFEYLSGISNGCSRMVDDWVILAPQHVRGNSRIELGSSRRTFSWFGRARRRGPLFGVISDPKHRAVASRIAGALGSSGDPNTEQLVQARRGVVVLYPIIETDSRAEVCTDVPFDPAHLVVAFAFVAPADARRGDQRVVRFTTIDSSAESAIIDTKQVVV